jgi:HK97 family phage major capsid protein
MANIGFAEFLRNPSCAREWENIIPPSGGGIRVPLEVLTRDLGAGVASAGGNLVSDGVSTEVASALRDKSIVLGLGGMFKGNLGNPTGFPVLNAEKPAQFVSEFATAPENDYSIATANMTPHRVTTSITVSKLLLAQSKPEAATTIAKNATAAIMTAVDKACLVGNGGASPVGIAFTAGVGKITLGGPVTLTELLSFESTVALAKAEGPDANLGWALSPLSRAALKGRQKFSQGSDTLMDDRNRILGYSTGVSTELSDTNQLIYANWSKVILGMFFSGVFVLTDEHTLAKQGETIITLSAFVDCGILNPTAACLSTDAAL